MKIPFVDLQAQYVSIKKEVDEAIQNCLDTSTFIGGSVVQQFESDFAAYIGVDHCIGCGNGTDALEISLKALGIGEGDEVIVPACSWIATSEAVSSVGARPVFVDILPDYYTIDPDKILKCINARTKAIIPVHLYGLPAEMDEIMAIAAKYGLRVIEDCAQAHGAVYKGKKVGTFGDAAAFSFFPGKNLGAYGDAGAALTSHKALGKRISMIGNHGQLKKHNHELEGRNSRLDSIHAAVLAVKLRYLDKWNNSRIKAASRYQELLQIPDLVRPSKPDYSKHVFHIYAIRTDKRDELRNALSRNGISTGIHYPEPLPFVKAYAQYGYTEEDFPVANEYKSKILSLPIYPELQNDQVEYICKTISSAFLKK